MKFLSLIGKGCKSDNELKQDKVLVNTFEILVQSPQNVLFQIQSAINYFDLFKI